MRLCMAKRMLLSKQAVLARMHVKFSCCQGVAFTDAALLRPSLSRLLVLYWSDDELQSFIHANVIQASLTCVKR